MSTSKRFYLNAPMSLVSSLLEDCVKKTMVGQAFGVDSGDTWELASHSSDEMEDWSYPKRYVVSVEGHVTPVLGADMGEHAREPTYSVLAIEVSAVGDEATEVVIDFYQPDVREHFNRLMAEIVRHWPHVRALETEPTPEAGTALPRGQDPGEEQELGLPPIGDKSDQTAQRSRRGGRPSLTREEKVKRLVKAQKAEELYEQSGKYSWKEVAGLVIFRGKNDEAKEKGLYHARKCLHRLEGSDPQGLLDEVAKLRGKERNADKKKKSKKKT